MILSFFPCCKAIGKKLLISTKIYLKMFYEEFHLEFYIKIQRIQNNVPVAPIHILEIDSPIVKISFIFAVLCKKLKK